MCVSLSYIFETILLVKLWEQAKEIKATAVQDLYLCVEDSQQATLWTTQVYSINLFSFVFDPFL